MEPGTPGSFAVKDCALLTLATGRRIFTLGELRESLGTISTDSLYYHFWGALLQPRFEEREYNNDFAGWVRHGLHDGTLAERFAMIDPREFADLERLRQELLELIEQRLDEGEALYWMRATHAFEFMRAQIVVFSSGRVLRFPSELADLLPALPVSSVFYHFIDARRRVPDHGDDFSTWLANFGEGGRRLCNRIKDVDPYFVPLTVLREQLARLFAEELEGRHASG